MDAIGMALIRTVVWVYDLFTSPFYNAVQQPKKKLRKSNRVVAVTTTGKPEGPYRRCGEKVTEKAKLTRQQQAIKDRVITMDDVLDFAADQYARTGRNCMGVRRVIAETNDITPDGRKMQQLVLGDYNWLSYDDVRGRVVHFGRGLRTLGVHRHDRVVIYAETRMEWKLAALACYKESFCVVTMYTTLGDEGLIHILTESCAKVLITSVDLLDKVRTLLPSAPGIKMVICMQAQLGLEREISPDGLSIRLHTFEEVESIGAVSSSPKSAPPNKDDLAMIMYTSGSTGVPKGVLCDHNNLVQTLVSFVSVLPENSLSAISFLPLAHIMGFIHDNISLLNGVSIAYSSPLTLTDYSPKVKAGCRGDIAFVKPDYILLVPLVLDRLYKVVNAKVAAGSNFSKKLFRFAYEYKLRNMRQGYNTPITNALFFRRTSAALGGRLKAMMSGGASVSPAMEDFVRICFCVPLKQAYGLTETGAIGTLSHDDNIASGRLGPPATLAEIKLDDWEEGGYTVQDKPYPRGEILISTAHLALGYLNLPDKTAEDFFMQDGRSWFRSGDIGEIDSTGYVKIIDRKKDLVKLQHGEYVSLAKVELQLKLCPLVDNVCVYCDAERSFPVALIVPNEPELRRTAAELNKQSGLTLAQICGDAEVCKRVESIVIAHSKQCKLDKFEIPLKITLVSDLWPPESGLVTAAMKLRRKNIQAKYQQQINSMYKV